MTDQPPRRETRRRAETRRRLIAAAREVFLEHSISDTPVELICETAGFSRGAFYSNFATKEDLFLAVYEEEVAARIDQTREIIEKAIAPTRHERSVHEAILEIGAACAEALSADKTWYLLLAEFRAHALRDPEMRLRAGEYLDQITDEVAELMHHALDELGMRAVVDTRDAVRALLAIYDAELERAVFSDTDPNMGTLFTEIFPRVAAALIAPRED
ncbi:TetR/AcrR family transcriptional regulator [Saccharopolyspora hordei]|uniref:AcrR family transcriptional regulator n=1 Tax=Saccharopolyspora hordei TaxID=1838 RepID=A0A853AVK2_9PSEU|nr:TetR/AcrR family transcriptional regulator [Saccharopolyspora hordei]NYI86641.1 AcrR family transcriptional regulator [Saccharopolyspora hordei]